MKRPLFYLCMNFICAAAAALYISRTAALLVIPAGLAVCAFYREARDRRLAVALALLGCAAGIFAASAYSARALSQQRYVGETLEFTGYVSSVSQYSADCCTVRTWVDGRLRELAVTIRQGEPEVGDWVSGTLEVDKAEMTANSYLFTGGVVLRGECSAGRCAPPDSTDWLYNVTVLRHRISTRMYEQRYDTSSALVSAVVFSDRANLQQEIRTSLSVAGMAHIISVSGLHLSIILGLALAVCRGLSARRPVTLAVGLAVIAVVVCAGGFSTSVLRSACMNTVGLLAYALRRRQDGLTSLGIAGALLCAVCPALVGDAGFLLSFSGTLGILLAAQPLYGALLARWTARFGEPRRLAKGVLASFAAIAGAQLGVAPAVAAFFGYVPTYGLLTNMLAFPLAQLVLLPGGASGLLYGLGADGAAGFLLDVACLPSRLLLGLTESISGLPGSVLRVRLGVQLLLVAVLCAALLGLLCIGKAKARLRTALSLVCVAALTVSCCLGVLLRSRAVVTSDAATGAVTVDIAGQTLLLEDSADGYTRAMESRMLLRFGSSLAAIARPQYADLNSGRLTSAAFSPGRLYVCGGDIALYSAYLPQGVEAAALTEQPQRVCEGVYIYSPADYMTCVETHGTKILKLWAGYGIIQENDLPPDVALIIDMAGNMYSPAGLEIDRTRGSYSSAVLRR